MIVGTRFHDHIYHYVFKYKIKKSNNLGIVFQKCFRRDLRVFCFLNKFLLSFMHLILGYDLSKSVILHDSRTALHLNHECVLSIDSFSRFSRQTGQRQILIEMISEWHLRILEERING